MSGGLNGLVTAELGRWSLRLEQVDSTNTYLKARGDDLPHGALCYTLNQTAGRGRRGRSWEVKPGQSLAMSLLFRPGEGLDRLPLLCGLAGVRALDALTGMPFRIKWPNDIVCSGQKVCGILCESRMGEKGLFVVAGMGFNLFQTRTELDGAGLPYAGSVRSLTGMELSPEALAASVANELEPLYRQLREQGFGGLREAYAQRCITLGREVRVLSSGGDVLMEGLAADIDGEGRLLVDTPAGRRTVNAGEVSVRGLYGYV